MKATINLTPDELRIILKEYLHHKGYSGVAGIQFSTCINYSGYGPNESSNVVFDGVRFEVDVAPIMASH